MWLTPSEAPRGQLLPFLLGEGVHVPETRGFPHPEEVCLCVQWMMALLPLQGLNGVSDRQSP